MNAEPLLNSVVAALAAVRLEAILIGNAAAAIQGAPVTTVDFDFMFRSTSTNLAKLKRFAVRLEAVILRPYYPASKLFRVMNDDRGLQADFMPAIHGVKSFNSLRSRAEKMDFGGHNLWVANRTDIIASNARQGTRGIMLCSTSPREPSVRKRGGNKKRETALTALRHESDRALLDLIRRRLALPVSKRLNFLRVRLPGGGSHL
jgi:hypothetical protein